MEIPSIFLNRILSEAAKKGAGSVHLTVGGLPKMRINGLLTEMKGENLVTLEELKKIIDSFIEEEEKKRLEEEREVVLVKMFAGNLRFRISIFYQKELLSVSFHYVPEQIKSLSALNLPSIFNDFIKTTRPGLFIIGGPYGSGKTTTIAAVLEEINKTSSKNIITLEDPIEYIFTNKKSIIEQREIGRDVKSITDGLNHCLEEDVDVVYLSRIKKNFEEAVPFIFELASGNSLVFLEMSSDGAIGAIEKILNAVRMSMSGQAARYNLADVLLGIFIQRIFPRRGGGMAPAAEILLVNSVVKSLIREEKIYQLENVLQTSMKEGMVSMQKSIAYLVGKGEVKEEDAVI